MKAIKIISVHFIIIIATIFSMNCSNENYADTKEFINTNTENNIDIDGSYTNDQNVGEPSNQYKEGYCYSYNAQGNILTLCWNTLTTTIKKSADRLKGYRAVIDPKIGITINEIKPFSRICGSEFKENSQRNYIDINCTHENHDADFICEILLIVDTDKNNNVESSAIKNNINNSDRKYASSDKDNLLQLSSVTDGNKCLNEIKWYSNSDSKILSIDECNNSYISIGGNNKLAVLKTNNLLIIILEM